MPQHVKLVITPSPEQYREICGHLRILEEHGGKTHTDIVADALRAQADRVSAARPHLKAA